MKLLVEVMGYVVLSSAGAAEAPATAVATPLDTVSTRSVVVDYKDLNLANPAGAAVLHHRIQKAAKVVCREYPLQDARRYEFWRVCYSNAVEGAVSQIGAPELTAIQDRTRRGPVSVARVSSR